MDVLSCKSPIFSSPNPTILKHLDPQVIYSNFVEIFGPPEQKFLIYLDTFEIFYPHLNLHSMYFVRGVIYFILNI